MRVLASLSLVCGLGLVAGCSQSSGTAVVVPVTRTEMETYDDPTYKLWADFPVGTRVVHKQTTENENNPKKSVTTRRYVLKGKSADMLTYEMQATLNNWDGHVQVDQPIEFMVKRQGTRPKGALSNAKPPKAVGEETLTVLGKEYKTRWEKGSEHTDAGTITGTTWSSGQMPAGLVKSVSKIPDTKSTISVEVVEVFIPQG